MPGSEEDGVSGVSEHAHQSILSQLAIGFLMADHWLDP
jgi:hypothetical protein